MNFSMISRNLKKETRNILSGSEGGDRISLILIHDMGFENIPNLEQIIFSRFYSYSSPIYHIINTIPQTIFCSMKNKILYS